MRNFAFYSLTGLLLVFFTQGVQAQVSLNPKVGVNVSNLDARMSDITTEARVGWNAGMDFRLGSGVVYLTPGVHYYNFTARLIRDVDPQTDIEFREETTIQKVKLPLTLGWRLTGRGGLLGIHARGGAVANWLADVKERPAFDLDKDELKEWTYGARAGVGLDLLFLTVDLDYEWGLSDFFEQTSGKNNMLTLSAGVRF
ncbi:MAG: outer membrane beta-barrel protein [Saprospiraceae bacterium]|nr:outer membrane beta-barrel protein [Saprospiraceae bacterium]